MNVQEFNKNSVFIRVIAVNSFTILPINMLLGVSMLCWEDLQLTLYHLIGEEILQCSALRPIKWLSYL